MVAMAVGGGSGGRVAHLDSMPVGNVSHSAHTRSPYTTTSSTPPLPIRGSELKLLTAVTGPVLLLLLLLWGGTSVWILAVAVWSQGFDAAWIDQAYHIWDYFMIR